VTFLLEHCNVPHNTKDRSAPFTIKYIWRPRDIHIDLNRNTNVELNLKVCGDGVLLK
jgi:hypothetical protein